MRTETRDAFIPLTDKFEGKCPYPYTDRVSLVTTCRGNLIDGGSRRTYATDPLGMTGPGPALALPWQNQDGSASSVQEISDDWWRVKNAWPKVQSVACERLTTIRLSEAAMDALTYKVLDQMWAAALKYFPSAEDWPACAQLGVLSMCWAMGGAFEQGYPHFDAAANAKDWATAAAQCLMTKPPVPVARNAANVKLFRGAASGLTIAVALSASPPDDVA